MKNLFAYTLLFFCSFSSLSSELYYPDYEDLWKMADVICIASIEDGKETEDQTNLPTHWKYEYSRQNLAFVPDLLLKGSLDPKYLPTKDKLTPDHLLWFEVILAEEIEGATQPDDWQENIFGDPHFYRIPPNHDKYVLFLKYDEDGKITPAYHWHFIHHIDVVY